MGLDAEDIQRIPDMFFRSAGICERGRSVPGNILFIVRITGSLCLYIKLKAAVIGIDRHLD
jgi:hypothetical protein